VPPSGEQGDARHPSRRLVACRYQQGDSRRLVGAARTGSSVPPLRTTHPCRVTRTLIARNATPWGRAVGTPTRVGGKLWLNKTNVRFSREVWL
jgi:hypothetical protein